MRGTLTPLDYERRGRPLLMPSRVTQHTSQRMLVNVCNQMYEGGNEATEHVNVIRKDVCLYQLLVSHIKVVGSLECDCFFGASMVSTSGSGEGSP